jgi:hypothetical protein
MHGIVVLCSRFDAVVQRSAGNALQQNGGNACKREREILTTVLATIELRFCFGAFGRDFPVLVVCHEYHIIQVFALRLRSVGCGCTPL